MCAYIGGWMDVHMCMNPYMTGVCARARVRESRHAYLHWMQPKQFTTEGSKFGGDQTMRSRGLS